MSQSPRLAGWYLYGHEETGRNSIPLPIDASPFTIGRAADRDAVLQSRRVSKCHAEIIVAGELLFLRDLASTNGTYVNGYRVRDLTPIGLGDRLQFADCELEIGRRGPGEPGCSSIDSIETSWLLTRMQEILTQRQFRMVYQPIVTASGHELYGVEALLRCDVPGLESPAVEQSLPNRCGHRHAGPTGFAAIVFEHSSPRISGR